MTCTELFSQGVLMVYRAFESGGLVEGSLMKMRSLMMMNQSSGSGRAPKRVPERPRPKQRSQRKLRLGQSLGVSLPTLLATTSLMSTPRRELIS